MSTLIDKAKSAGYQNGMIVISMESGSNITFPVKENPHLANGTPTQLNNIEISPFGIHWPDLDEDLSFRGLISGDFG
ncbi:MAG: DUF2442 domain-containing protein [Kiritimatiellae bacterium]|nr:DUF2442 domain-containing protein [Kiritimatiellia bacterium]